MKTLILLLSTFVMMNGSTSEQENQEIQQAEDKVYICKGKGSTKYHLDKDCRGLTYCSTEIYEVSLESAKKMGRSLCGWED